MFTFNLQPTILVGILVLASFLIDYMPPKNLRWASKIVIFWSVVLYVVSMHVTFHSHRLDEHVFAYITSISVCSSLFGKLRLLLHRAMINEMKARLNKFGQIAGAVNLIMFALYTHFVVTRTLSGVLDKYYSVASQYHTLMCLIVTGIIAFHFLVNSQFVSETKSLGMVIAFECVVAAATDIFAFSADREIDRGAIGHDDFARVWFGPFAQIDNYHTGSEQSTQTFDVGDNVLSVHVIFAIAVQVIFRLFTTLVYRSRAHEIVMRACVSTYETVRRRHLSIGLSAIGEFGDKTNADSQILARFDSKCLFALDMFARCWRKLGVTRTAVPFMGWVMYHWAVSMAWSLVACIITIPFLYAKMNSHAMYTVLSAAFQACFGLPTTYVAHASALATPLFTCSDSHFTWLKNVYTTVGVTSLLDGCKTMVEQPIYLAQIAVAACLFIVVIDSAFSRPKGANADKAFSLKTGMALLFKGNMRSQIPVYAVICGFTWFFMKDGHVTGTNNTIPISYDASVVCMAYLVIALQAAIICTRNISGFFASQGRIIPPFSKIVYLRKHADPNMLDCSTYADIGSILLHNSEANNAQNEDELPGAFLYAYSAKQMYFHYAGCLIMTCAVCHSLLHFRLLAICFWCMQLLVCVPEFAWAHVLLALRVVFTVLVFMVCSNVVHVINDRQ
jgi:hypothetical protein